MSYNYKANYYARRPQQIYKNQLGAFNLTPDTVFPTAPLYPIGSASVGGLSTGIHNTPTFTPTIPPPSFPSSNSTVQQVSNTITGQLKFDQIAALISQGIAAWGKNPSQQISGLTVRPVQTGYSGYGNAGLTAEQLAAQQAALYAAQEAAARNAGAGSKAVGSLSSALEGIASSFGLSTSVFVLLAAGGIYLLMREPPRRR